MDLMSIAQKLISQKLGNDVDVNKIVDGLQSLLGDKSGGFNIGSLVSNMSQDNKLGNIVGSWLGDGNNQPIDSGSIGKVFGADRITNFASRLGLSNENASSLLADVVPNVVDQSSSGGSLLDGIDGILNLKKLF